MEEFKAVLGIIQAMGKEASVELLKSQFVKVCIGLSLLAWAIDFKLPAIITLLK